MKRLMSILLALCLSCGLAASAWAAPEIFVPEEYTQSGTLPIYRAAARDFGEDLRPELFNPSGIASRDVGQVVFADEAILDWAPEALSYQEYHGTFDVNAILLGGDAPRAPDYTALPALSGAIAGLASWAYHGWPDTGTVYALDGDTLTHLTLADAQATLEALLAALGMTGYVCDYALDMSVARIMALGADMNARIAAGTFFTNVPPYDFAQATAEDEGFYLTYHKQGGAGDHGSAHRFSAHALVTRRGVVNLTVYDLYIPGDVYSTPQALVAPEQVLASLPGEMAASRFPAELVSVASLHLTYAPMRAANKADGMVLSPVWLVLYTDEDAEAQGYTCWAEFDAVDGKLLDAIFK